MSGCRGFAAFAKEWSK